MFLFLISKWIEGITLFQFIGNIGNRENKKYIHLYPPQYFSDKNHLSQLMTKTRMVKNPIYKAKQET